MLKNINIRKVTLAISAIWCLAVVHPSVSAQTTDTGTLTVNGTVVTSTCLVNFRNSGTSGFNTSPVLELGSVKAADFLQTGAAPATPVVVGVRPAWAQYADLASFSTTMELNGGLFEEACASFVLSKLFKSASRRKSRLQRSRN